MRRPAAGRPDAQRRRAPVRVTTSAGWIAARTRADRVAVTARNAVRPLIGGPATVYAPAASVVVEATPPTRRARAARCDRRPVLAAGHRAGEGRALPADRTVIGVVRDNSETVSVPRMKEWKRQR